MYIRVFDAAALNSAATACVTGIATAVSPLLATQANAPQGPRRYNQLLQAGEEDDADLVDEATVQDREWDAFKEANPKGWGNKAGKRF